MMGNLLELCIKVVPYLLGYNRPSYQDIPVPSSNLTLTEKDLALLNLKSKDGSVILAIGSRDTGKTELCYRLAEFLGRPTYAVSPQQVPPSWIQHITLEEVLTEVQPDSTLIMDDLPAYMSNRDYNEGMIRVMEKSIPMVRHDPSPPEFPLGRIHLIFSTQSTAQADRYIMDCDAAFFKPLGLLMGDIERPNIARMYRNEIDPCFAGKNDMFIKKHAYMMSRTFKGMIEVNKTT
jgi:hypothetical protein